MACVNGELGKIIDNYYNLCLKMLNDRMFDEALTLLLEAWKLIPEDKYSYNESFLIA